MVVVAAVWSAGQAACLAACVERFGGGAGTGHSAALSGGNMERGWVDGKDWGGGGGWTGDDEGAFSCSFGAEQEMLRMNGME